MAFIGKLLRARPQSPIGPLVASAFAMGKSQDGAPTPFRGYYYLLLTRQGKNGPAAQRITSQTAK